MSLELRSTADARVPTGDNEEGNSTVQTLEPTDKGASAWKMLFVGFIFEGIFWGFASSFGVFQEYYARQPEFENSSSIAIIGTVCTSTCLLGAPFATPLVKRFQRWQRSMVVSGWVLCVLSLLGASFATSVGGLIATQGLLYGLGFLMLYYPVLSMLNEWFVQRRGLAYGVVYAGGGVSGIVFPFILESLLSRFGFRVTLRAIAVAQFIIGAPVMPFIKARLPPSAYGTLRIFDLGFLSEPLFYCFALSNLFQGFAYYIPSLYLPSFAFALGLSGTMGALILAVYNIATVIGQVTFGYVSDRVSNVLLLVFISSFVSSIAVFTIWGFAHSLETLLVFSFVYGWFAGAYPTLWTKFGSTLADDSQGVYSMMSFGKGIGNIAIGPLSAALLSGPVTSGYGMGKYEPLILLLGGGMFCSSLGILGWPLKPRTIRSHAN